MPHTTLEVHIRRLPNGSLTADAALTPGASTATSQRATGVPIDLDTAVLLGLEHSADDYGRQLSAQLFADQRLREAWLKARAYAESGALQLRLHLDVSADDLHAL